MQTKHYQKHSFKDGERLITQLIWVNQSKEINFFELNRRIEIQDGDGINLDNNFIIEAIPSNYIKTYNNHITTNNLDYFQLLK